MAEALLHQRVVKSIFELSTIIPALSFSFPASELTVE